MEIELKEMELKYKTADVEKLIDVFSSISEKKDNPEEVLNELMKIKEYPTYVLKEFLDCMTLLSEKDKGEDYLKENYLGIIGYITLRLNFATEKEEM